MSLYEQDVLSGIGGNLASSIFLPEQISVGASSSLFGIIGMVFIITLKTWTVLEKPFRTLIVLVLVTLLNFVVGLLPFVDNFAHIGGFITGDYSRH